MFEKSAGDSIPQLDAMRLGVDYHLTIKVRGFTMTVRPLSISEHIQVASRVIEKFDQLPKTAQNRLTENMIKAKETLIVASTTDVDTNDPKITDYILDRMTDSEVQFIWKQYLSACDKVNPVFEEMEESTLREMVEQVKKNPDQLTELSFLELVNVSRLLIRENSHLVK